MGADSPVMPRARGSGAGTLRFRLVTLAGPACSLAGVVAALASVRPWVHATLADRGADLLREPRSGWDLAPAGQLVLALGALVTLLVLVPRADAVTWLRRAVPVAGVAIMILPLTALDAGEPIARKLERLRIGTFQTDAPVATHGPTFWLWLTVAAGIVILLAGSIRLVAERNTPPADERPPTPTTPVGAGPATGLTDRDNS